MSKTEDAGVIDERARALARMYLTRREDLVVRDARREAGLDYLVSIMRGDNKPSTRQFGVVLRAARDPVTEEHLNRTLRPTVRALAGVEEFPYPVCLLFFTMQDNQGYYTWVAEPVLREGGAPRLQLHAAASCARFDREALDSVVSRVDAWYNALFSSIVAGA